MTDDSYNISITLLMLENLTKQQTEGKMRKKTYKLMLENLIKQQREGKMRKEDI